MVEINNEVFYWKYKRNENERNMAFTTCLYKMKFWKYVTFVFNGETFFICYTGNRIILQAFFYGELLKNQIDTFFTLVDTVQSSSNCPIVRNC